MGELNVSFQIDTDNREKFPSSFAFTTFKKQRDSFYEILKIWEENHSVPGWVFQIALGGKIRTMLTMCNDATNYCHFARLFKSQLLISCVQNGQKDDAADDESVSFLKTLKNVNPEKLTQLKERLIAPLPSKNNLTGPSFPGVQEFFKDFILHAFNPIFYVHLENCLVHEIMELNDSQFASSEIEDSETIVDEQTKQNFITCLSSLKLLAKVLGLIVALPYRSESSISKEIIDTHVDIRSNVLPALNLQICLQHALKEGKLSLTMPWIVEYLAMLDVVSLRLPYFKQILEILYYIFWSVGHYDFSGADSPISQQTAVLLKSILGWMFELPNFPKDLYLTWQKNCKEKELKSIQQFNKQCIKSIEQMNLLSAESAALNNPAKHTLDKLEIIDDKVLRTCCPYIQKKRAPLISGNGTVNNSHTNRHITPVSSRLTTGGGVNTKHLELQLEEAFFHGQPASTRKTVEFVSERVASTCVKQICNTLLASTREDNLNAFRKVMTEKQKQKHLDINEDFLSEDSKNFKCVLTDDMNVLASKYSKELKDKCEEVIPAICEGRVAKSIDSLLAEDSLAPVKEMCVKITTRMAMERIHQWIQSHIVGGSLFIKDMQLEIKRFLRNNNPTQVVEGKNRNTNAASPTYIIVDLRNFTWELLDTGGKGLTLTTILNHIERLYESLNERADFSPGPAKILYSLSIDFALFLLARRPDLCTEDVQNKLIRVWKIDRFKSSESNEPTYRWLSPRNVMLLAQPENSDVWLLYGKFLRKLLKTNVLSIEALSDQCVALFRQEWPVPLLKHLSKCLTEAIADYKASNEDAEKVKYLLGWVAETYHEIEFCDDYNFGD